MTALTGGGLRSLDDRNARPFRNIFDSVRGKCLSLRAWPWTVKRVRLVRQAAPDHPYLYGYPVPVDALVRAPLALYDSADTEYPTLQRWANEAGVIYTDRKSVV